MSWIYTNIDYPYEALNLSDLDKIIFATGNISGVPQLCAGRGVLMSRLMYMNGIKTENIDGTYNGTDHWWNRIYTENGPIYYDATGNNKGIVFSELYQINGFYEF